MQTRPIHHRHSHIYRAVADSVASSETLYRQSVSVVINDTERAKTLEEAQAKFLSVMGEHRLAMEPLFNVAHKTAPKDSFGPSRENDPAIFKEQLDFLVSDVAQYKVEPVLRLTSLYMQQEKRHETINTAMRNFKLYCQQSSRNFLNSELKESLAIREQKIRAAHIDFCRMQALENPNLEKVRKSIRKRLRLLITVERKAIPEASITKTINTFMDAVHDYPNFLSIYKYLGTLLATDGDKDPLMKALFAFYLKDPNAKSRLRAFAYEGADQLAEPVKELNERIALRSARIAARREARQAARQTKQPKKTVVQKVAQEKPKPANETHAHNAVYSHYDPTFRNIVETTPGPIPQSRALMPEEYAKEIRALMGFTPKKAPIEIGQPIGKIAGHAPLTNAAKNPQWYKAVGASLKKYAAYAAAAAAVVIVAVISWLSPAPNVKMAADMSDTHAAISAYTQTQKATATSATAATPSVQIEKNVATVSISSADTPPIVDATDFKPTQTQASTFTQLATDAPNKAPSASTTPSWARGTLGMDMGGLSKVFAEPAQDTDTAPAVKTIKAAPVVAPAIATTVNQLTDLMIKKNATQIGVDGDGTVQAEFNDFASAFKATQGKDFNAKAVKITSGATGVKVSITLK